MKSDSRDIYNATNKWRNNAEFSINQLIQLGILKWFLKDHVRLRTGIMTAENAALFKMFVF